MSASLDKLEQKLNNLENKVLKAKDTIAK